MSDLQDRRIEKVQGEYRERHSINTSDSEVDAATYFSAPLNEFRV